MSSSSSQLVTLLHSVSSSCVSASIGKYPSVLHVFQGPYPLQLLLVASLGCSQVLSSSCLLYIVQHSSLLLTKGLIQYNLLLLFRNWTSPHPSGICLLTQIFCTPAFVGVLPYTNQLVGVFNSVVCHPCSWSESFGKYQPQ